MVYKPGYSQLHHLQSCPLFNHNIDECDLAFCVALRWKFPGIVTRSVWLMIDISGFPGLHLLPSRALFAQDTEKLVHLALSVSDGSSYDLIQRKFG